ncbi:MAG: FliM/FliN family flagellar motor switch protein [Alphaproteobacteria bacterium]|nr:FliM/FliN family flagellar motor switch protein [Alphaproteobacteria bacterium]
MDLGLRSDTDFMTTGNFSPEEISALINPIRSTSCEQQSAIQILLNQGAEYLAQRKPSVFENLMRSWHFDLSKKSPKIQSLSSSSASNNTLQNPLFCSFNIEGTDIGYIAFDWRVSYILIDGLLGGVNGVSIEKKQEQPYSVIEKNILQSVFGSLLTLLGDEIKKTITIHELTTHPPFEKAPGADFTFLLKTPTTTGKIYLKLPLSVVPQRKETPLFSVDDLKDIPLPAQALIGGMNTTLSQAMNWQVGTTLTLGTQEQMKIALFVNDMIIASGHQAPADKNMRQIVMEDIYDI